MLDGVHIDVGQIDLVDDRDDLEVVVDGQVQVGDGLRFNALRGIDDQQCALAGGQAARHLIGEIHVARRVDEVEQIGHAVTGFIFHGDGVHLDGDAPLTLQIHAVQHLVFHLIARHRAGGLQQPVGQRGFAVIDVGDDAKISYGVFGHTEW
ncbi:MAG: hypothetical protein BWY83_00249 [bacterium ADurb.Bin478]|nr:MAG: hypothetical protein BWY83_00249 [bacterium ADurb.Bin478]